LSRAGLALSALLYLCAALPALAADDPLPFAAGVWQGKGQNGREAFTVSVTLKKVKTSIFGICRAKTESGDTYTSSFEAYPERGGRNAEVKVTGAKIPINFEVFAQPLSGTKLSISSVLGEGSIKFLNDFIKAEFEFRSVVTDVSAVLYRVSPPPAAKTAGGRQGGGKKAPSMPPMVIVPP